MTGDRLTSLRVGAAFALAALAACGTAQPPSTPDHSAERSANAAYFANDFNCTRATSENIGLKLLNIAPQRYLDKCIRLEAFTDGTSLYVDAKGIKPVKASNDGLYWKDPALAGHLKLGPSFVVITGRVRDCAKHNAMTAQAAALESAPGAVPAQPAIIGACKTSAAAIFISDAQVIPTAMD
ncbi:MAG TPA: hypothetical protein VID67_12695 [Rhizomicrobium sp.]|jgi:hypothetical protein